MWYLAATDIIGVNLDRWCEEQRIGVTSGRWAWNVAGGVPSVM